MTIPDTHNRRIAASRPLVSPAELRTALPLTPRHASLVATSRDAVRDILSGADDRLLVVVGPCSVHDTDAGLDYATRLAQLAESFSGHLLVVMRCYFEKPRTTLGWKGLINDPHLDGSFEVNDGLHKARRFLLDVVDLGLPAGCEFLDPITPQYTADLVTWGSIGARTAHSQIHRQLASGLSMPIGIKNSPEGDVQAAVDALAASAGSHIFPGIDDDGRAAVFTTTGNADCHVVLRGTNDGPNHSPDSVGDTLDRLEKAEQDPTLVIDASHGNSLKDPGLQVEVIDDLARRISEGEPGIVGLMIESFIARGRQNLAKPTDLAYGLSITDACISWEDTVHALETLAHAVQARATTN